MFDQIGALQNHWYVLAHQQAVPKRKPKRWLLWQVPIVLWRTEAGEIVAMLDRCPHRDVPLSRGSIHAGRLRCPYHGWEFAGDGRCVLAPALGREAPAQRRARVLPVRVSDDLVWVWPGDEPPTAEPPDLAAYRAQGMKLSYRSKRFRAAAIDLIENFVDASHTPILHRGVIRGHKAAVPRQVRVRADANSVTVYHEESADEVGIGQRFINPHKEPVLHSDRFQLPSLVQVDYKFGNGSFLAFIFCTPVGPSETVAHVVLGVRFGWATPLVRLLLPLLARLVLYQDARVMRWQADNLQLLPKRADGFLECDLMHIQAHQLWRHALANKPSATSERCVTLHV